MVVGVEPGQPALVAITAAGLAAALGGKAYFAYADPTRVVEREFPDGSVQHVDANPDLFDDESWRNREAAVTSAIRAALADTQVAWEFRYLAGRPDRALTHLARAVDAAAIVIGSRRGGAGARAREFLDGSIAANLVHHQHRPVLVVPTRVVDWKDQVWTR